MKYVKITFVETAGNITYTPLNSLEGFRKDRLYRSSNLFMIVDLKNIQKARVKFKKLALEHYKQLMDALNIQLAF